MEGDVCGTVDQCISELHIDNPFWIFENRLALYVTLHMTPKLNSSKKFGGKGEVCYEGIGLKEFEGLIQSMTGKSRVPVVLCACFGDEELT